MKKPGRNDPCPCGSGKKFKKCCESSMLGGRFKASKIEDGASALPQKMSRLTGLFHTKLADIPSLSEVKRTLKPTTPPEENPPLPDSSSENSHKEIES